ncbi:hypothetical protein OPQ81_005042 [Rhizoctonia solani]|nr:hypothetical protein OPQ81_005042 [Rhizoctonia solani]
MFSRVVLRRLDPATAASSEADDLETQPLSPREPALAPEMTEQSSGGGLSRLLPRRMSSMPSRFRFSNVTDATSAASTEWPGAPTARTSRSNTAPTVPPASSSVYSDDDDEELGREERHESSLPDRFSVVVDLPSTRLHLPGLQRTWTQGSNGPPSSRPVMERRAPQREPQSPACRPRTPPIPSMTVAEPSRALVRPQASSSRLGSDEADELYPVGDRQARGNFTAADPAETQLAEMAADGRRRRQRSGSDRTRRHRRDGETAEERQERRRRRRQRRLRDIEDGDEEASNKPHPKRFLFCFPWIRSRKIRSQIVQCFVSGMFLVLLLTTYLALSATKNIANNEFSVLLILIILFAAIFFFQGLIRLCLQIFRPKPVEERRRSRLPQMYGPGGYAIPRQPIRVVLARDEEAAGIESEATKTNPPAYGLWRESVRVDPNRIYWQRNTETTSSTIEEEGQAPDGDDNGRASSETSSGEEGGPSSTRSRNEPRPPSYASEDGVSYVVEARPRSIAPLSNVEVMPMPSPLPVHPSELGRIATPPNR